MALQLLKGIEHCRGFFCVNNPSHIEATAYCLGLSDLLLFPHKDVKSLDWNEIVVSFDSSKLLEEPIYIYLLTVSLFTFI